MNFNVTKLNDGIQYFVVLFLRTLRAFVVK